MTKRVLQLFVIILTACNSRGLNLTTQNQLYEDLQQNYNTDIRPADLNVIQTVNFSLSLVSINRFDELNGELDMTSMITMRWKDSRLAWNSSDYGGLTSIMFPPDKIWKPQVYILNAYDLFEVENKQFARVEEDGVVTWEPAQLLYLLCSVYVLYFPFDVQKCKVDFSAWAFSKYEMVLSAGDGEIAFDYYHRNRLWQISKHEILYPPRGNHSVLRYDVYIKRRDTFMIVYVIIPVVLVGSLNCFVFLIPASAGERTSVAVTAFLAFVVFMTMINGSVPASSDPVAYLFYYMLFLLSYSGVIMIMSILSLQIYEKEGKVSSVLKQIVTFLSCGCLCKKRNREIAPLVTVKPGADTTVLEAQPGDGDGNEDPEEEITWKDVGLAFDRICFVILLVTYVTYSLVVYTQVTGKVEADGHV
ncbi:neuronal acetylcholine receptor subunit alpha-6-like [Mercenaria mercenaria]|uniref:neuronal acetylcholine receptor subunit alpha-6-like n=1 Tax=Mercenaria mercenaria TaxID=6596 RepID=UPI00234ECA95|nr:neuronal acetylcholine receptor subunit alpha-6-like [Mercenaria mercenaria]